MATKLPWIVSCALGVSSYARATDDVLDGGVGQILTFLCLRLGSQEYVIGRNARAGSKEIVAAFNRGLDSMKEDGTFDAILSKDKILQAE